MIAAAWIVFRKELRDALRDRRTLLVVILSSVAVGPLVLALLSTLVAGLEQRAEAREVWAVGLDKAPTLKNYLLRQTYTVREAPADHERQLLDNQLSSAVLVVPPEFEAQLARGEPALVEIVSSSANQSAQATVSRLTRLVQGLQAEQASLRLAVRGVSPAVLQVMQVEERDLANPQTRAANFTSMLPFFVVMAVLYGALNAALDTTAGERERGSLEPLLMTPAPPWALALGKWGAVACVGMLVAVLSCLSFLPGQWLLRSETLSALFQFGLRETGLFLLILVPLAGAMAAVIMAVAIRSRSFKEAQANTTVIVMVVALLPMVTMFSQGATHDWHRWLPGLAQSVLMNSVLKGEALSAAHIALSIAVCAALAAVSLAWVSRQMKVMATR